MMGEPNIERVSAVMRLINRAWLEDRVDDLGPMIHPEVVMVFPGFTGQVRGREGFLAGFREFSRNATIQEYSEHDHRVDIAGGTAVVSFRYEMLYERLEKRYKATGRDLWVFQRQDEAWLAAWRTMLDLAENEV